MPDKQLIGLLSRRKGQFFEELLLPANQYYAMSWIGMISIRLNSCASVSLMGCGIWSFYKNMNHTHPARTTK